MKKTVKAYHPLEMAYHKFMFKNVFLLIITGLPFFSKTFDFIPYAIGFPLSGLLGSGDPMAAGVMILRVIHWMSGFLLVMASILFLVGMIIKLKNLSIWPDRWGIAAIFDGIKQMRLHYLEGKPAKFGKMNFGQKASAWVMAIAMGIIMVTGVILVLKNLDPAAYTSATALLLKDLHSYSFIVLGLTVIVHVFFALLPSNKAAFKAMFRSGEMDLDHVKEHHPLWYEKLEKKNLI